MGRQSVPQSTLWCVVGNVLLNCSQGWIITEEKEGAIRGLLTFSGPTVSLYGNYLVVIQ